MKKLLSSSEIAALKLPGLPGTKVAIKAMAKREGWYCEERTGLGGRRMVYEVPARYLGDSEPVQEHSGSETRGTSFAPPQLAKVVGHIAAGSSKVDPAQLELAIRALNEWEQERGVKIADERRPAVIALLYDYVQSSGGDSTEALGVVFRALG